MKKVLKNLKTLLNYVFFLNKNLKKIFKNNYFYASNCNKSKSGNLGYAYLHVLINIHVVVFLQYLFF